MINAKKRNVEKIKSGDIAVNQYANLDNILCEQTGINGGTFELPLYGGDAAKTVQEKQKNEMLLNILDAYHEHFNFMNIAQLLLGVVYFLFEPLEGNDALAPLLTQRVQT